jgi:hypothetical protein
MMFQLDMVCVNLIIQVHKSLFYTMVFTVIFFYRATISENDVESEILSCII